MKRSYIFLILVLIGASISSCENEIENPYDNLVYSGPDDGPDPDPSSLAGIHKNILSVKCAVPGCHDGNFEPDFRTIESTYSTLLYHPVFKNNANNDFDYRVVPGDTSMSWLHERITTDDPVLGRMPLYDTLYPNEVDMITQWILNGARDILGNQPSLPNFEPLAAGLLAYLPNLLNYRVDTIRGGRITNPFNIVRAQPVKLWFAVLDDKTTADKLTENKLLLSKDPFDFSGAEVVPLDISSSPILERLPGSRQRVNYYHNATIDPSKYQIGDLIFMRLQVKDEDHSEVTETPSSSSPTGTLTYFSFYVAQ